jgi:hypothetical protein
MPMAAQVGPEVDAFDTAREELERMIGTLREGGARAHTEVIAELCEGGAEVQRHLFQGWLDRLLEQGRRGAECVSGSERWSWSLAACA